MQLTMHIRLNLNILGLPASLSSSCLSPCCLSFPLTVLFLLNYTPDFVTIGSIYAPLHPLVWSDPGECRGRQWRGLTFSCLENGGLCAHCIHLQMSAGYNQILLLCVCHFVPASPPHPPLLVHPPGSGEFVPLSELSALCTLNVPVLTVSKHGGKLTISPCILKHWFCYVISFTLIL